VEAISTSMPTIHNHLCHHRPIKVKFSPIKSKSKIGTKQKKMKLKLRSMS
jgi:hypothetical protein